MTSCCVLTDVVTSSSVGYGAGRRRTAGRKGTHKPIEIVQRCVLRLRVCLIRLLTCSLLETERIREALRLHSSRTRPLNTQLYLVNVPSHSLSLTPDFGFFFRSHFARRHKISIYKRHRRNGESVTSVLVHEVGGCGGWNVRYRGTHVREDAVTGREEKCNTGKLLTAFGFVEVPSFNMLFAGEVVDVFVEGDQGRARNQESKDYEGLHSETFFGGTKYRYIIFSTPIAPFLS